MIQGLLFSATLLLALAPTTRAQQDRILISNAQYGYSISVPSNWRRMPEDILGQFAKTILTKDAKVIFDAAFQPPNVEHWFEYPYILIQVTPYKRVGLAREPTLEDIKRFVKELSGLDLDAKSVQLTDEARDLLSDMAYHQATFDQKSLRVSYDADLNHPKLGAVRGRALGQFGKTAYVQVVFYDRLDNWESLESDRKLILQSLKFEPDLVLHLDEPWLNRIWDDNTYRVAIIVGLLGVCGALCAVAWRNLRPTKPAKHQKETQ